MESPLTSSRTLAVCFAVLKAIDRRVGHLRRAVLARAALPDAHGIKIIVIPRDEEPLAIAKLTEVVRFLADADPVAFRQIRRQVDYLAVRRFRKGPAVRLDVPLGAILLSPGIVRQCHRDELAAELIAQALQLRFERHGFDERSPYHDRVALHLLRVRVSALTRYPYGAKALVHWAPLLEALQGRLRASAA